MKRLLVLLALGVCPALVSAQTLVFAPAADATVREDSRTSNHASSELIVQRDDYSAGSRWKRAYLRFDVSGLAGGGFDCITLELTEGGASQGDTHFEVRSVDPAWSETGLTWTSAPPLGGRRLGVYSGPRLARGQVLRIPLDPTWIAADGSHALALVELRSGGMDPTTFRSREQSGGPRLVLGCDDLPPLAGFTSRDHEGPVPFTPQLTNASPGDAVAYLWDFGDGSTSTEREPSHAYLVPGRYDVALTVTRANGSATCIRPGMFLAHPADTALGSVLGWTKISAVQGGASPPLRPGDMFGRSVAGIGDLDGDGTDDLVVGAIGEDRGAYNAGAAWVLFLEPGGTVRSHVKIAEGLSGFTADLDAEDGFGRKVAGIGDLDGDGVADIAVGANRDDDGGRNRGAVYLLFMNPDGSVKAWRKLAHGSGLPFDLDDGDELGRGIARLEDMDGDGTPELAVGAIGDDDGGGNNGAVWILYMRPDGTVKQHAKLSATSGGLSSPFVRSRSGTWFGMDVAALGDVDGDGTTDIAVGALLDDAVPHGSGALYVILLNPDGSAKSDHLINGTTGGLWPGELEANDEFGGSVAGPGDVDGDGVPDVACSAIRDDDNPVRDTELFGDWGAVYLFFLRSDGSVREYQKISATRGGLDAHIRKYDRIGEGLGALGDVNGDGVPDLAMGSRFDDGGGSNKGAVHLLHLNDGHRRPPTAGFTVAPPGGPAPLAVLLEDTSTGDVDSRAWDLGDGASTTGPVVGHVYAEPGTYTVRLRVSGASGSDEHETSVVVTDPDAIRPLGCGVNPAGSFTILSGTPRLGATLEIGIDNPLGTQAPGALPFVYVSLAPDPLTPCGTVRPGIGMAGPGAPGELLLDRAVRPFRIFRGPAWTGPGVPARVRVLLPASAALAGVPLYLQGRLIDRATGAAVRVGVTDGVRIVLQP